MIIGSYLSYLSFNGMGISVEQQINISIMKLLPSIVYINQTNIKAIYIANYNSSNRLALYQLIWVRYS